MAVVSTEDGRTVIDVTVPTTTFTIVGPEGIMFAFAAVVGDFLLGQFFFAKPCCFLAQSLLR